MKGLLIFPALIVCLLIGIYYGSEILIVCLLFVIGRVLLLKNFKFNLLVIALAGVFLIRCQSIQPNSVPPNSKVQTAIFSPDSLTVNGDGLSGELRLGKVTTRFTYRIKTESEQHFWQELSTMVQGRVIVKKMETISGPRNPADFDFKKYQNHKNINYTVQLLTIEELKDYQPRTILEKINVLRIHIINYLAKLPKWLRIHAQSLIVGYTKPSDKDFLKLLSILGVIHLFSLSGLHVLILLTIFRKITSVLKIPLEWIDTGMLLILPCYGLLVGSKSGIWRAIVLAIVGIIVKKRHWSLSRLDIFSLTIMICLFIYPFAIVEMGGQLSFLLSFAILYLYQPSHYVLASFKMNLVSLPLICYYVYQFNWLTLLANLIFVPFFTYFILPITLISSLTVSWSFWQTINQVFTMIYQLLDLLTSDQNFMLTTGKLPLLTVLSLVIFVMFYLESKSFWNKYLKLYLGLFVFSILINKFPLNGGVHLIDVGQGDSILITTPLRRQVFMIDVGGKLSFPTAHWARRTTTDQVDNTTIPFLKSQGITTVDKLFLTHKDVDHVGNLETLLSKFKVREVNFGIGLENNPRIKQAMKQHPEVSFVNHRQGDQIKTSAINWQVLWPKVKSVGENGDSLTLLAKIKNKRWLFTGDLDLAAEKAILSEYQFKIDYLKVGHHGSKTATSDELLEITRPQLGFISSGVNNRYHHPNQETLDRLQKHQVQYFNTAEYGMISWYYFFWNNEEKITTFLKGDLLENNRIKK